MYEALRCVCVRVFVGEIVCVSVCGSVCTT